MNKIKIAIYIALTCAIAYQYYQVYQIEQEVNRLEKMGFSCKKPNSDGK
jgi:cell division protein FtsL